jgi:archaellum component FlaC
MSVTLEVDLKEALDKINQKLDKLEDQFNQKFDKLEDKVDRLSVDMATVKTKLEGLDKRLENQEFVSRGLLVGLVIAILGSFAKLFGFVGSS